MKPALKQLITRGDKSPMPGRVSPMLCTLVTDVPTEHEYIFEIKWDGYRIISYKEKGSVRLDSRSGKENYTLKYTPVAAALKKLKHDLVLDGEVVAYNDNGLPEFNAVQNYPRRNTPINYFIFDILWIDSYSLKQLSYTERRQILKAIIPKDKILKISDTFEDGIGLFEEMQKLSMEGIVAKRPDSIYKENERRRDWLKIPTRKRQEFVIGGWAESDKVRSFRSLLFGAYNEQGKFEWIGRSGGGYKDEEMPGILGKLKKLEVKYSPFKNPVLDTKGAKLHWTKPKLVANFEFADWTPTGRIRKPAIFKGFRTDKNPRDVVREVPRPGTPTKEMSIAKTKAHPSKYKYLNADSNWRYIDDEQKNAQWSPFKMKKCTVQVHNLDREIWAGFTKAQLLLYYSEMSKWILPHIKERPISLVLKLENARSKKVFIKDMENRQPECADLFEDKRRVKKAGKRSQIDYLVCNNPETLFYMIDLGAVDINCWASKKTNIEYPDYIWLDLDPTIDDKLKGKQLETSEKNGFLKAIKVARVAKKILDKYELKSFIKTSGQTGLHIYIPCTGFTFVQTRNFAEHLADQIQHQLPKISTTNVSKAQRQDRVYIDAGQNDYADTLAAPYSIRPYHKPIISTPLDWKEVTHKLNRYDFTIETVKRRLKRKGDLFKDVLAPAIQRSNSKTLQKLIYATA